MINPRVLASLRSRDLLADEWSGEATTVGLQLQTIDDRDRYVGSLLAGACDALGRPGEGLSPWTNCEPELIGTDGAES